MLKDILIGSTVFLAITQSITGFVVSSKNKTIEVKDAQIAVMAQNNHQLKSSIDIQNKAIEAIKLDYNASITRYNDKVPTVVYVDRWITKYVDKNVTGDCNEILTAIRSSNF